MSEDDVPKQFRGLWLYEKRDMLDIPFFDYGLFRLWIRDNGEGKILERYHQRLAEADVSSFMFENEQIYFEKKYRKESVGLGLTEKKINYRGRRNPKTGLYEGYWDFASGGFTRTEDRFYLTEICNNKTSGELGKILLDLEMANLLRDITALKRELPFTPVIP